MNYYYDNAATSFPKPTAVATEIARYLTHVGGTYGRGAYSRIIESSRIIEEVRELLATILGTSLVDHIVFTPNATHAINTVLFGMDLRNKKVLVSPLEHNAVMRPLEHLKKTQGVSWDILPHKTDGMIDIEKMDSIDKSTARVIVNHQSNVNGVLQPIREIKQKIGSIPIFLDISQSLGHTILNLDSLNIDYCAFTGHKGLLGPTGTGGLFIRDPETVTPFLYGGTGSRSEEFEMPFLLPDKYEAGTPNIVGIHGLYGALKERPSPCHTLEDLLQLIESIRAIENITVYAALDIYAQGPVFSVTHKTKDCSQLGRELLETYKIETRTGLHCAPLSHKTLQTFPFGTVRIAPSLYHNSSDFEYLVDSLKNAGTS